MPNFPVSQQIRSYFGRDGQPLNGGYIYFGTAGLNPESSPVQMTWDAAGTQPAPQPFRTLGGFIIRGSTPANVYASGDFSSTVYDSAGQLVYTVSNSLDFEAATTVAATNVTVADAGGFFATATAEAVLQEIGTSLASLATGNVPTGATFDFCGTVAPSGFVLGSGRTIGNVASAATERNNADTAALYTLIWNASTNTELPIQDSAGTPTTRGANAAADFAANKRLPLPDCQGRIRVGKDNMSGSTAGRITNAGSGIVGTTQFATGGAQNVTLDTTMIPAHLHAVTDAAHTHTVAHTHTITDPTHSHSVSTGGSSFSAAAGAQAGTVLNTAAATGAASTGITINSTTPTTSSNNSGISTTTNTGGGAAHSNVQPMIMFTVIIKL